MIPFNKQNLFGKELEYISDAFENGKISGDGKYTKLCSQFMEERFGARKVLLTASGSHALDMAAILIDLKPGDEVIMPSYTFVSTVNAVVLRGAKPVFCEIREDNLNIDESKIAALISDKTRAIFPVHYAGVACDMDKIMEIAKKYDLFVIEDAAQGVNAKYKGRYLGTIGHLGCYSFHETKNYSMGEGGAIVVNDDTFRERAEIIREKGTNRSKFYRGEVDKYTWVDIGSSFLPSDINAAVLWNQLEHLDQIQKKRIQIYNTYYSGLRDLQDKGLLRLPIVNDFAEHNAHMFYILLNSEEVRDSLMGFLKENGVHSVFHYIPLHLSDFHVQNVGRLVLPITENLSGRLLRLPMYFSLQDEEIFQVIRLISTFLSREDYRRNG